MNGYWMAKPAGRITAKVKPLFTKISYWSTERLSILQSQTHGVGRRAVNRAWESFYRFSPRLDLHCALSAGTSPLTPTSSDSGHRGAGNPGLSPHFVILNKWGSQWSRPLPHTDLHLIRADTHAASFLSCCVGLCHGLWSHLSFYLTNNKKERKNAPRDVHGK